MAPKHLEDDQGNALSTPKRDIFPFFLLPAEIRIRIYKIDAEICVCGPSRARPAAMHCSRSKRCWHKYDSHAVPFPPHVRALLQVEEIREDMLPHLHLAWVVDLGPRMGPRWKSFKHYAIPAVSHLTIGVTRLFNRHSNLLKWRARELLRWMRWQSHHTSEYGWNLRHLTLIEGSDNWTSNPNSIMDKFEDNMSLEIPVAEQIPGDAGSLAIDFPMIKGLSNLNLALIRQPGPVWLDTLSRRCKAHGVDLKITVTGEEPRFVHERHSLQSTQVFPGNTP